jgi:MSHA biogenesis protein MshO
LDKNISYDSPYYRYFRISTPVTYYFDSGVIYRSFNYALNDADRGTNNLATSIVTNVLSKDVSSLRFEYLPPTLLRNGMVKIEVVMKKNDIQVVYAQNVHIRNKP